MSEDSFFWLVDARYELQHESIDTSSPQFQLSDLGKRLLQKHGILGFTKACGTHFYVGRTLGARYNLLYEFRSQDDKVVEKVRAAAKFSATFGLDGETEMSKAIQIAKKATVLKVHSGISGGGPSIADYAEDVGALKKELQHLRDDLFVRRQGEVLRWELVSYEVFDEVQDAYKAAGTPNLSQAYKREALALYYTQHTFNADKIHHLRYLLNRATGQEAFYAYTPAHQKEIQALIAKLVAQNEDIGRRATNCLNDPQSSCSIANLPQITQQPPQPDADYSGLGKWLVRPVLRGNTRFVDFYGKPPSRNGCSYSGKTFVTGSVLVDVDGGVAITATDFLTHKKSPLIIGDVSVVPDNGVFHPKMCIDNFAARCSMRIVEDTLTPLADGCPNARFILVVYDENGVTTDRYTFRLES